MSANHPCSPCSPSSTIYEAPCPDPGAVTIGAHLATLDSNFCPRRLSNGPGFLINRQTGGGWRIEWSTEPNVPLSDFQAVTGQTFGQMVILQSDGVMRALNGPVTPLLVLMTNAAGQLIFAPMPAATVPDPLTLNLINVTTLNVAGIATFGQAPVFNNLTTAAITQAIGLNASNQLVVGSAATTGTQSCMFYEAPTSPSPTTPNAAVTAGSNLIIGNEINSSLPTTGQLIAVTTSELLTVVTGGFYLLDFCGQVTWTNNQSGRPAISLLINGVDVNDGNSRPDSTVTTTQRSANLTGFASRRLNVGDTLQLQLASSSGVNVQVYQVRLRATRTGP